MLKLIRNAIALMTLLALGACNSITAPQGGDNTQDNEPNDKQEQPQEISGGDELEPDSDHGGGGRGPGERDNDEDSERNRNRNPHDWAPDFPGGGGPGSSAGSQQGGEEEEGNEGSGEGGEWTPDA